MTLESDRLILRAAQPSDLNDLFTIFSNPAAMRYWSTPPHATKSQTQENLDRLIASSEAQLVYCVFEHQGKVIGLGGLHHGDEIGFLLHPDFWQQGFGREAMETLIPHIFATTDASQLTADVDPRNTASIKLLTALGFKKTHSAKNTFCINGIWSDSVYFAQSKP